MLVKLYKHTVAKNGQYMNPMPILSFRETLIHSENFMKLDWNIEYEMKLSE